MARRRTRSQNPESIARSAMVWIGVFVLLGNLGRTVPRLSDLLCDAAGEVLGLLPSVVVWAGGVIEDYAFAPQRLSECLLHLLLSLLPLFS
jgi:hypothetical protein